MIEMIARTGVNRIILIWTFGLRDYHRPILVSFTRIINFYTPEKIFSIGQSWRRSTNYVKSTGCGFDLYSRKLNIYLHLYFHFFALVSRQSAALSSVTQHALLPELDGES